EVDRSSDGVSFTSIATLAATATSYTNTGLSASTKYYYRVLATDATGKSVSSNVANATTLASGSTVTNLSTLTWTSATVGYGTIQKNASINGNPITLRGKVYATG